jgi:uncharacterized protein
MKIQITVRDAVLSAILEDNATAQAIYDAMPFDVPYNVWGDEIYCSIPVHLDIEEPGQEIMAIGDLAYWPPGHAFCIFYGRTPASTDERPRAASEVVLIGKIDGDATILRDASASSIKIKTL